MRMAENAQTAMHVFMVRPACFGSNAQTADSNAFQQSSVNESDARQAALNEFDVMVAAVSANGVHCIVFDDLPEPVKPDAVFPNNWITTHASGAVRLYPLEAPNRRPERRQDIVTALVQSHGFHVSQVTDWSDHEHQGFFLEGTGSLVLDRVNQIAYAARSSRTHDALLELFAAETGYEVCAFDTAEASGLAVYHTNVLLAIGSSFIVICESVIDSAIRKKVMQRLEASGRQVIAISPEQMHAFAGNMLEVKVSDGSPMILLSETARAALKQRQIRLLETHAGLLPLNVQTIERIGGGSVRCMLAEIFLPQRASAQGVAHGV